MKSMSYTYIWVGVLIVMGVGLFGIVNPVDAAQTQAISLSPTHTLLVTTYTETLLNRDGVVPLLATKGANSTHAPLVSGFEISSAGGAQFTGTVLSAVILSTQPVLHGGYTFKKGEKTTLKLVVLISHGHTDATAYQARITSLPILLTTNNRIDGKTQKLY